MPWLVVHVKSGQNWNDPNSLFFVWHFLLHDFWCFSPKYRFDVIHIVDVVGGKLFTIALCCFGFFVSPFALLFVVSSPYPVPPLNSMWNCVSLFFRIRIRKLICPKNSENKTEWEREKQKINYLAQHSRQLLSPILINSAEMNARQFLYVNSQLASWEYFLQTSWANNVLFDREMHRLSYFCRLIISRFA